MIAVTGSQGQLGSEFCRQLGAQGIGLDLPDLDLTDGAAVQKILLAIRPTAIVNTAAYTLVDKAEQEPAICRAINADAVEHLAGVCRQLDCPLVQISTDYVFSQGGDRKTPYRETDEPSPRGVYACAKREGELRSAAWRKHFVVRTCGLYGRTGPRSAGNFVATMLRLARQGRALRVVDDQYCTPTYVPHLVRAIRFLLTTEAYGTYHVVNAGQTTWFRFAAEIFRLAGLQVQVEPITTAEYGAAAPRPAYSVLDIGKFLTLPGRPELPTWQEALAEHWAKEKP